MADPTGGNTDWFTGNLEIWQAITVYIVSITAILAAIYRFHSWVKKRLEKEVDDLRDLHNKDVNALKEKIEEEKEYSNRRRDDLKQMIDMLYDMLKNRKQSDT